jgi:uncharacterized zinc-type alcohol dehydrogenase-like protein
VGVKIARAMGAQVTVLSQSLRKHGVAPEVEIIGAEQINPAWERVLASDVRLRFVIDISTLAG